MNHRFALSQLQKHDYCTPTPKREKMTYIQRHSSHALISNALHATNPLIYHVPVLK